jgi:hypothetical protein
MRKLNSQQGWNKKYVTHLEPLLKDSKSDISLFIKVYDFMVVGKIAADQKILPRC